MPCLTCQHRSSVHNEDGCRVTGCPCYSYADPMITGVPIMGNQQVTFEIPSGYILNVQLVPMEQNDADD